MERFNQIHDLQSIDELTASIQSMINSEGIKYNNQRQQQQPQQKDITSAGPGPSTPSSFADFLNPQVETFVGMHDDPDFAATIAEFDNLIQELSNNIYEKYQHSYQELRDHATAAADGSGNSIVADYTKIESMDETIMNQIAKIEAVQHRLIAMKEKNIEKYQTYKSQIDDNITEYHSLLQQMSQIQNSDILTYREFSRQNNSVIEEENYYYLMATLIGITFVVGIFNLRRS